MENGIACRPDLPPDDKSNTRRGLLPHRQGLSPGPEALSLEQRQFAAEQHNLIYAYLKENGLYHGEYYDMAALG